MLRKSKGSERREYPKEEKQKLERFRVCVFLFFLFFFFNRWLGVFIDTRLMKVCLPNTPYGFLKGKLYTCQHFKGPFFLT